MRIAWFSPWPPVKSGVATCSAELVPALRARHEIDVFTDESVASFASDAHSAHEFVWRHRQTPYDLTVYQLGNSSLHDYLWPYLFRFPGLLVLHDAHLHHARAAALLTRQAADAYRAEFRANHPDESPDAAELAVAGFDSYLYYMWPMTRLAVEASKLTAVHSRPLAAHLAADMEDVTIEYVRLSQGTCVSPEQQQAARQRVRERFAISQEAVLFGCFGGLTLEKRLPQILDAFQALAAYAPDARLMLGGASAPYFDLAAEIRSRALEDRVIETGYLATDQELTDAIAAVDVTLNLRWPTAREVSGPWLRALAAGKPSIIVDLVQTVDLPTLDPRTWTHFGGRSVDQEPVAVAIDILDEDHSLRLAMRRLAEDDTLRRSLGDAAQRYWLREHSPEAMRDDYERLMAVAREKDAPKPALPMHLLESGTDLLERLLKPFGMPAPFGQTR
ncbi:MAG: glycosyltransferase family 4 protein [Vicinamibacterales bacterium]